MIIRSVPGPFAFEVMSTAGDCQARRSRLRTPHGTAELPAFMPVGTAATVKGCPPDLLAKTGSEIVLCNTYHLALRPGESTVQSLGGLHQFMKWPGPILTDSGGFQVWSLSSLVRIDEEGAHFRSHLDGSPLTLGPERAMEIQTALGSDIIMVLDECLSHDSDERTTRTSIFDRTLPWSERCLRRHPRDGRALFAIGQGALHESLRREHAKSLRELPFDGFAIGGLSVGETGEEFRRMIAASCEELPANKPRYLMGVGSLPEILDAVALGVDMFDCVLPTRNARNGQALTMNGPIRLRNRVHAQDNQPIEPGCPCSTCTGGFSRGYLRHLFMAKEMLGGILATVHNLQFMQRLMEGARQAISAGHYDAYRRDRIAAFRSTADR